MRFPPLEESDLIMKVLAASTQQLVASPKLLAGLACPLVPANLGTLPDLDFGPAHHEHQWCLEGPDGATALVPHQPRLVTDDMIQMRLAALQGVGVVQLPTMMVDKDLADGTLMDASQLGSPQRHCARRLSLTARTAAVCAQLRRASDGRIQRVDRGSAGSHRELIVRPRDVAFWPLSDFTRCPA